MSILPAHSRVCLAVVICLSGAALAQEAGEPLSLLDVLDVDGDGALSAREITRSAVVVRKLDRNRDGRLTDDELTVTDSDADTDADTGSNTAARSRRGSNSNRSPAAERRGTDAGKKTIDLAINRAATFYMQKNYEEAGKQIEKAQELIEELLDADDQDALADLTDSLKRLGRAHTLLTEQGIDLPDLLDASDLGLTVAKPRGPEPASRPRQSDVAETARDDVPSRDEAAPRDRAAPRSAAEARNRAASQDEPEAKPRKPGTVSYAKQIAPILVKRCGDCHVKDNKAELSFTSYTTLMAGSEGGPILVEGSADESILIDMIESGDMPPKGEPLPEVELKLIRTWVDEGAVNDGEAETPSSS